jgi:hypothetical protein
MRVWVVTPGIPNVAMPDAAALRTTGRGALSSRQTSSTLRLGLAPSMATATVKFEFSTLLCDPFMRSKGGCRVMAGWLCSTDQWAGRGVRSAIVG